MKRNLLHLAAIMVFPFAIRAAAPTITLHPQSQTAVSGTNVTFTVAANDGSVPTLPNVTSGTVRLWLKADAGVITNGIGSVSQWQDQSGNANHASQSNTNLQPVLVRPSAIGGRPAIRFDGIQSPASGDFLSGVGDVGLSNAYTSFLVYFAKNTTNVENIVAWIGTDGIFGAGRGYYIVNQKMAFATWFFDFPSEFTIPTNTYRLWTDRFNTNRSLIEMFDSTATTSTNINIATSSQTTPPSGYFIGGLNPASTAGRNFSGDIAELIYFRGFLTESDRQAVEFYLKLKYFPTSVSSPGLAFQWQFGGTNIPGATNTSLTLTNIQASANGNYSAVVTNSSGTTNSSNAVLTVLVPVSITSHPQSQSVPVGSNVTFNVTAAGNAPFFYQWKFNGADIAGATSSEFTRNNVQLTNAGNYSVAVSNAINSVTSSNAALSIATLPVIISQPQDAILLAGENATISVELAGIFPPVNSGTLRLWLKADSGVITDSSNRVSQWLDQSGQTNHCFQTNLALQPFLSLTSNGVPTIRFDGIQSAATGDFLQGFGNVGVPDAFTSFFVYSRANRTVPEQDPVLIGVPNVNNSTRTYYIRSFAISNEMSFGGWANDIGSGFALSADIPRVWTFRMNTNRTLLEFFDLAGTNSFTTNRAMSGLLAPGNGYFIGGLGGDLRHFQGDISEVLFYQGTLSDFDRLAVEDYLEQKHLQPGEPQGSGMFSCQWQLNGTNVTSATNLSLVLTNAQPLQNGNYTLILTNSAGSVTSAPAVVTIRYIFPKGDGERLTNSQYSFTNSANISFDSYFTNGSVFFTLDGSTPSFASQPYTGPFILSGSAVVRAINYSADFLQSGESQTVNITVTPSFLLSATTAGGGSVALNGSNPFLSNTAVNVTATPSNGWTFLQWLGDAAGTNPITSVNMTRNKSVQAIFGTTLSTTVAGNGSVSVNPESGLYPFGTIAHLTATPQPGNYFAIWGNAASGNTNPLDFAVITPNPTVSSLFSALSAGQFSLTIAANGSGHVAVSPRANRYSTGQVVSVTATPDVGQIFTGWSGDASGTTNPLSVTMNQSKAIVANFTKTPRLELKLAPGTFATEGFQLTLTGPMGENYLLQNSTNLSNWSTITAFTNFYGTSQFSEMPSTNSSEQFYRAIQP
jgi:hypothetical protein